MHDVLRYYINDPSSCLWIRKFGENPDIDTTTDPEDLIEQGGSIFLPSAAAAELQLRTKTNAANASWQSKIITSAASYGDSHPIVTFGIPEIIDVGTDVLLSVLEVTANDTVVQGGFDIVMIP